MLDGGEKINLPNSIRVKNIYKNNKFPPQKIFKRNKVSDNSLIGATINDAEL